MASGVINGTTGDGNIISKIEWSSVPDIATNKSKVTAALYYMRTTTEGSRSYGYRYCSITINGVKANASGAIWIYEGVWEKAAEGTTTVSHKDDGSMSIEISAEGYVGGTALKSTTCSGTAVLDTIARASTITSAGNVILGTKCGVKWTPMSADFRYKLKFSLGSWSHTTGTIHPNTTAAYMYSGYTIPLEVAKQMPDSATDTMTVTLYTYSDSNATKQVGAASSKTFTVKLSSSKETQPDVAMTLTPVSSLGDAFAGLYIQSRSKVKATLSAEGKYGATVKAYSMKVGSASYGAGEGYTSGYLADYGTVTVFGYATDSRGLTGSASADIQVIPYSKPKIKVDVCGRCDAEGNLAESGTFLKIKATRSYSTVEDGGVQKNFCKIRFRYKAAAAESYSGWTTILAADNLSGNAVETGALLDGALSVDTTYNVQVQAIDDVGEYGLATVTVPTEKVYWHRDGSRNSFTFGGYVEEDNTFAIAAGIDFKVKSLEGKDVTISDTGWIDLGLSESMQVSGTNVGRNGKGCYYRVINGGHVYVAFNCACTYANAALQVNLNAIPTQYRPARNAYALVPTGGRSIVRAMVNNGGQVLIDWVQAMVSAEQTTDASIVWVDGYIDYWL